MWRPRDDSNVRVRIADGWLEVTIPIESLGHAAGQLLGLGADVEVIAPADLRDRVRDMARAVLAIYAGPRAEAGSDPVDARTRRTPSPRSSSGGRRRTRRR